MMDNIIDLHAPSTLIAVDETEPNVELDDSIPSSVMNTEENDVQEMEVNEN